MSVIIPVYNAEKYITQCIESLLNQTLRECEFIFINDGSTDNSEKIIEDYKKINDRITLINQENQGVSIARNRGLDVSTGEYVGFVDADDYIEKDMYEMLYNAAK
ncbi:glycosyltransferase [Bacillus sp. JJ927]|uniref:glycosyltransferase n=1 Tax=Bacillus sp. JJ927 TaxID=3122976 RepID=UPI00339A5811